jgi:hypothetical protein
MSCGGRRSLDSESDTTFDKSSPEPSPKHQPESPLLELEESSDNEEGFQTSLEGMQDHPAFLEIKTALEGDLHSVWKAVNILLQEPSDILRKVSKVLKLFTLDHLEKSFNGMVCTHCGKWVTVGEDPQLGVPQGENAKALEKLQCLRAKTCSV